LLKRIEHWLEYSTAAHFDAGNREQCLIKLAPELREEVSLQLGLGGAGGGEVSVGREEVRSRWGGRR